jgi:hypothetical protein
MIGCRSGSTTIDAPRVREQKPLPRVQLLLRFAHGDVIAQDPGECTINGKAPVGAFPYLPGAWCYDASSTTLQSPESMSV